MAVGLVALWGNACASARYLTQAAAGQFELLHRARPLALAEQDPATPPHVRALLAKVPLIKAWGQTQGLKPTRNYGHYADLKRSAAVYVVQGCATLEFRPKRWSFPIVGSVPYLGYFSEAAAREAASRLAREEPLDVTVRTASAYSTLGWFKDPVLSTMIADGPEALGGLANTILHESVHATAYVPGQSAFDESLASFVADALTPQYLAERSPAEAAAWREAEARHRQFRAALTKAHEELDALYRSGASDAEKLARKTERLAALQGELGLKRPYNNADLAGVRTYETGTAGFERLRAACGTWPRFLAAVRTLEPGDFPAPQSTEFDGVLDALAGRACARR